MAKIDTSKIEGYADMTAEQKVAALEGFDGGEAVVATDDAELKRLKAAVDKANSEAAGYKKELRAKQSDDERAKAEQEATLRELQEKYDALLKESALEKYTAAFKELGYEEKLAADTARALLENDCDAVVKNGKAFKESFEKSVRAEMTASTPKPAAGGLGSGQKYTTREEIMKIKDAGERQAAIRDNIELFTNT